MTLSPRTLFLTLAACCVAWRPLPVPAADYSAAIRQLEAAVTAELEQGHLSGVAVALVDDQGLVHAGGFGFADKLHRQPVMPDTVFRCGSISKLFTALSVMQLVERGELDLDEPVNRYLPAFRVQHPFADDVTITLRELLCHRSGLIREAPVGSYFDATEPGPRATVGSLVDCVLVHRPGTRTKYSNSGITVVGEAVAAVTGKYFEQHQAAALLAPLGMTNSAWWLEPRLRPRLARGYLPVADGRGGFREIPAPQFEFGILAAGNLYTTAPDLARFLSCLFADGRRGDRSVVSPASLAQMFTPQLTTDTNGFGLGFHVGHHRGHPAVSHSGAVYGFSSSLVALTGAKLGVVVLANDDLVSGPVKRLSQRALDLLLEAKLGVAPPARPAVAALSLVEMAPYAGDFESESYWARVDPGDGVLRVNVSGQLNTVARLADGGFRANGRLLHDAPVVFSGGSGGVPLAFTLAGQTFRRVDPRSTPMLPAGWRRFIGSYGPEFIPVIVSERHGHLYAMTENMYDYRLTPLNRTTFRFPPGMYEGEELVFQLDVGGHPHGILFASIPLKRRAR